MRIGVRVGDIMTRDFVSVKANTKVLECIKKMEKNNIGSLIIKDNSKMHGILTEGDIINAIARKKNIKKIAANEVMTRNVVTIKPDKDIYDALVLMKKKKVRWLPVALSKGKIIGLLTIKDIVGIEPALFDIFIENEEIKEKEEKLKAAKLGREYARRRAALSSGTLWAREGDCQECGAYDILYNVDGRMLCEECKEEEEKD